MGDYDEKEMVCPESRQKHVLVDSRWLNFSIKKQDRPPCIDNTESGCFENTEETAHHRRYKKSGWETLARKGITERLHRWYMSYPVRRFYSELAEVAPTNGETPMFDPALDKISPSGCRDDLEIIWMKPDNVHQIVLDKSGSMSGTSITNARNAAKLLIDLAQEGSTTIGVIAFDSQPRVVAPLTAVLDAATKTSLKAAIDTITAGGNTAIGEGAQKALDDLRAFGGTDSNRFVFLLSDGVNNSGRDPLSVIPAYQEAQIPIFSFAYGTGADLDTLTTLAEDTEGQLFVSPTSAAEIAEAFQDANTAATGIAAISTGEAVIDKNTLQSRPFAIDSTIETLVTTVVYSPASAAFELISPSGMRFAPSPPATLSSGKTLLLFDVDTPAAGTWHLEGRATTQPVSFSFRVSGPPAGETYVLSSGLLNERGELFLVSYPAPMLLLASLHHNLPIVGASVHAEVTDPDGNVSSLTLVDDGNPPDAVAGDGLYSGALAYDSSGVYEVLVTARGEAGVAAETVNGLAASPAPDGSGVLPPPDAPLVEDFERFVRFQATARGVVQDDHGDTPALATEIDGENLQVTPGRIEVGGDVDVFAVDLPPDADAAALRISGLALDMDPLVRLLASDESTVLAQGTLATHSANRGYLLLEVEDRAGQRVFAEVAHRDASSGTGTYEVSAGRLMDVDLEALDCPVTPAMSCLRSGASKLSLKDGNPAAPDPKDSVSWSWLRGPGLTKNDFVDPTDATDYALCIYADGGAIASEASLSAGEICSGAPCWTPLKTAGFRYADRAATWSGITSLSLAGGDPGKSKIVLKGKGQNLNLPALPLDSSAGVVVQLRNSAGSCWESVFPPSSIQRNTANQFSAASP